MQNIEINRVTLADIDKLQLIGRQTFFETFSETNTAENLNKYLDETFSLNKLRSEINNSDSEFYFAIVEEMVIGYLKINFGQAQTELQEANTVEVERIYVLKNYYGKNVGQSLFKKALDISRQREAEYIWLGVWERNLRAISFYKKNGFVEFGTHIFKMGNEEQSDLIMKLDLKPNLTTKPSALLK